MRMTALFLAALAVTGSAMAQNSVNGYFRKDGTYVSPYIRSMPNDTKLDNYSTKGNYNPYTGKAGTVDPYKVEEPKSTYDSPYSTYKPKRY